MTSVGSTVSGASTPPAPPNLDNLEQIADGDSSAFGDVNPNSQTNDMQKGSDQDPTSSEDHRSAPAAHESSWTFMTNHAHVLFCLARDPDLRLRDVAARVGVTERAVQRIVADLHEGGFLEVHKQGRRNRYVVHPEKHLRHPVERHRTVAELIRLILPDSA